MSTPAQLRPLALYEELYARQVGAFAIPAGGDPVVWAAWRTAFRARLRQRLGDLPAERAAPAFVAAPPTAHPGYRRTYLEYSGGQGAVVPAWLLVPDGPVGPGPAVVALHGHGYGVNELVGLDADGRERDEPFGFHQDFALALCRQGMVVLAPELRGFGRRREGKELASGDPAGSSCHEAAWWGIMLGKPLLGSRVWDALQAFDLLRALPEVDAGRVGVMGGSGGGAVALLAAGLEQGVRATVISSYFCTFRDSILALRHCHCNYVPGLLQDGEMHDLAALIAPRPLLVAAGDEDPIFPLHGVLEAYGRVHGAYVALGAADRIENDVFAGGHQIAGAQSYDFLWRWLSAAQ